jgi:hypothetical protein
MFIVQDVDAVATALPDPAVPVLQPRFELILAA